MSDKLAFRSAIRFEAPQENDRFEGARVRYAGIVNGEVRLEFFNERQELCSLSFPMRDLKAVLDLRTLFSLFRR